MNNRSAQVLAATLAFLLIVLVGATIFILLSRPAEPGPTASPSGGPSFTPTVGPSSSASLLPSFSFPLESPTSLPPTDTPSPTVEPTITPTPSPSPSPSPSPTPLATLPPPTAPQRQVTVVGLGFDQRTAFGSDFRRLQFVVDGPSLVRATLSGVNAGRVRVCISRNAPDQERECKEMRAGTLSRAVFDAGKSEWIVELMGLANAPGQFGTVAVDFNALTADLELKNIRFNGTDDPHNNGFLVLFGDEFSADGTFTFRAAMDGISSTYPWHYILAREDLAIAEQSGGPSSSVDFNAAISGGTSYNLLFEEPESSAATPAFVDVRLTWP